jgi:eukaryotic-like serine/threonine-protein kinase
VAESCALGGGLLDIMRAIHQAGVVHRDLKPGNIFLLEGDAPLARRLKVLVFGIAKMESMTQITVAGSVEGTVEYIAPESLGGFHQATPSADYYSFGIILYRLFFGSTPFDSGHLGQILRQKAEEEVALPVPLPDGFPSGLADLVTRLTRRDPVARLTDPQQIAAILTAFSPP